MNRILYTSFLLFLFQSCSIQNPNKYYKKAEANYAPFDAIIVPGVPFNEDEGTWSRTMKMRVHWAKYLWDRNMCKNIIFSGGAVYTKYAECKIMRLYAIEMGIPDEHIFMDSLAEHSTENVYFSYWVAQEQGFKSIALASDPYQTKTLKGFVKKLNRKYDTDMQIIPANIDTIKTIPKPDIPIEYQTAEGSNFINITETQKMGYRLRGTMGLNVDWKKKGAYKESKHRR